MSNLLHDYLEQAEAELSVASREFHEATAVYSDAQERLRIAKDRFDALSEVASGLRRLREAETAKPAQERLPVGDGGAVYLKLTPQGEESVPRGQEAVRLVLRESPRAWRLADIVKEVISRNWIDPNARQPDAAVRVAVTRLVASGEAEKVGKGLYRYKDSGVTTPDGSALEAEGAETKDEGEEEG